MDKVYKRNYVITVNFVATTDRKGKECLRFTDFSVKSKSGGGYDKKSPTDLNTLISRSNQLYKNTLIHPSENWGWAEKREYLSKKGFRELLKDLLNPHNTFERILNTLGNHLASNRSRKKLFTKTDQEFVDKLDNILAMEVCTLEQDGASVKVSFPILDGSITLPGSTVAETEERVRALRKEFSQKTSLPSTKEKSRKTLKESKSKEEARWQKREKEVAQKLNDALREKLGGGPEKTYAVNVGGDKHSDVFVSLDGDATQDKKEIGKMVSERPDRCFFVEVKLNYYKSKYLKFNTVSTFTVENGKVENVKIVRQ